MQDSEVIITPEDAKLIDINLEARSEDNDIIIDGSIMSRTTRLKIRGGAIDIVALSLAKAVDNIRVAREVKSLGDE